MSATRPAQVAPTLGVIEKVFFEDLLTRKFPNAILFSLASTIPPSKVTPTAVAPGMYIDINKIILSHNKGLSTFYTEYLSKIIILCKHDKDMAEAEIKGGILTDITFLGLRLSVGLIFILHGWGKINPGFLNFMGHLGLPPEMQYLIVLAEVGGGIVLIFGIFSRIGAVAISITMLGAIFLVKSAQSIDGDGGVEFDLILLAAALVIMVAGPGRVSLAHAIKRIPRAIH